MIRPPVTQFLSALLSFLLVLASVPSEAQDQQPAAAAPLPAADLEQLVAPIALYPDALVAQILGAATFPDQVTAANDWLQQQQGLTGKALSKPSISKGGPERKGTHAVPVRPCESDEESWLDLLAGRGLPGAAR